jgi:hypothetical protein
VEVVVALAEEEYWLILLQEVAAHRLGLDVWVLS